MDQETKLPLKTLIYSTLITIVVSVLTDILLLTVFHIHHIPALVNIAWLTVVAIVANRCILRHLQKKAKQS